MAKAAAWSCVLRFDAGRANHSRMIAFRASACVIALDVQAWPRLRNLAHVQRTIAHDYRPEADALSSASGFGRRRTYQEHGTEKIRDMIVDDIRASQPRNDKEHVLTLLHVLHVF